MSITTIQERNGFQPDVAYTCESEFTTQLSDWLDRTKCVASQTEDTTTILATPEQTQPNSRNRPDIQLRTVPPVEMKYRSLSNPFYIECKLGREHGVDVPSTDISKIHRAYNQLIRYKYHPGSEAHNSLSKQGDYHIAVTAPSFLTPQNYVFENNPVHEDRARFIRVLWRLGIGVLYLYDGKFRIAFNEQEEIILG